MSLLPLAFISEYPYNDADDFAARVELAADNLNVNPSWLMAVMYRESALEADAANKDKNGNVIAAGLNQIQAATATGLGTSISALLSMTAIKQMDYVEEYFKEAIQEAGRTPKSVGDMYLLNFYPAAVGKPYSYVIYKAGSASANGNAILQDETGSITAGSVRDAVNAFIPWEYKPLVAPGVYGLAAFFIIGGLLSS